MNDEISSNQTAEEWHKRMAEHLTLLRKAKFNNQTEFASALTYAGLPTTQQTVSYWESGKRRPSSSDFPIIAKVLGVSVRELLPDQ